MAKTTKKQSKAAAQTNTPGVLVLQWLTYAFWGWTVVALAYLTAISINYFVNPVHTSYGEGESVAYSLAAVIVLLLISTVCDFFYSKHEPAHKAGAATVIMIIHAVIFALCGIAALIVAVFAIVNMLINTVSTGNQTALYTGLVIAVVYAATLLRTIRPLKLQRASWLYTGFMVLVTIAVTTLGIIGPVAHERSTRTDRLIESGLYGVSAQINRYSDKNDKLPTSLGEIRSELKGKAADIVEQNLVEYKPGGAATTSSTLELKTPDVVVNEPAYEYQLCVVYKAAKGNQDYYDQPEFSKQTSPNTYYHDAGPVCYDLQTRMVY